MKNYKLKAILETTGGELHIECIVNEEGTIDCVCKDAICSWTKEFFDRDEVWNYLHNVLHVKNVIRMMEVF